MSQPVEPLQGLPPVTPPSGRFIAQLFLVPGLIVVGAVSVLWGFTWLVGASRTPEQFLKDLGSANAEVRWRAASDLAQVLKRDQELASNPKFALDLADLLSDALREHDQTNKQSAPSNNDARPMKKRGDRDNSEGEIHYVQFLLNCLGNCNLPVGVPLLCSVAANESGVDTPTTSRWQGVALWSLACLGDRLKHLDSLPEAKREEIIQVLDAETANGAPERSLRAQQVRDYLKVRFSNGADTMGVDRAVAACGKAKDPGLRKLAAFTLSIWEGDEEANGRMEDTLLSLTYDDGHGAIDEEGNVDPDEKPYGLKVRYQAVEGLARRGSEKISKRMGILSEMLDEEQLSRSFRTRPEHGERGADLAAVSSTIIGGLKAVAELHRRRPEIDFAKFQPAIDRLTHSQDAAVRAEAERTQITLQQ